MKSLRPPLTLDQDISGPEAEVSTEGIQPMGNAAALAAITSSEITGWLGDYLDLFAGAQDSPEVLQTQVGGLFIAIGDPDKKDEHRYTPGMSSLGDAFADDVIAALDALIFGMPAKGEEQTERGETDIADVDFDIFNTLEGTGGTDPKKDPEVLRKVLNSPARSQPGIKKAAKSRAVHVNGNVVTDFLEGGKLASKKLVIADAAFNEEAVGDSEHISGVVYWNSSQGMCVNGGTADERRAPPMMLLKHELTHGWMDHFFDPENLWAGDQWGEIELDKDQAAEWDAYKEAWTARHMEEVMAARELEDQTRYNALAGLQMQKHVSQTPYGQEVYDALLETAMSQAGVPHSNELLVNPSWKGGDPHLDQYTEPREPGDPLYEEEEMVTDNEYYGTEALREWAAKNHPEMLGSDGVLPELGNRTHYGQVEYYEAAGPLSSKKAP